MRKFFGAISGFLAVIPTAIAASAANSPPVLARVDESATARQTQAAVIAAQSFLSSLDVHKRAVVVFPFVVQKSASLARFRRDAPDQSVHPVTDAQASKTTVRGPGMGPPGGFVGERYGASVWSNFPVSDVPRPGLQMGQLTPAQHAAALYLLQTVLSPKGYQKVLDIMGADQALANSGTPFASGKAVYTLAIFGDPAATKPWMIQFGGHHLGLNIVIDGEHGVMTPTLTGAQPAIYQANGRTVRVLAAESDRAFTLLDALDAKQRQQAILPYKVQDLVQGPGHDGEIIIPEGVKVSTFSPKQKELLMGLISEWAGIINDTYAAPRLKEIREDLNDTWFAWSGPTTHISGHNGSAYYRIQGPRLWIEFSPQGVGDDPTLHVHTVYRDPTNSYGNRYTAQ